MKRPSKSLLILKYFHLSNKELAKIIYGKIDRSTLRHVYDIKYRMKKRIRKIDHTTMKAYILPDFSTFSHLSYSDLKHYETTTPFHHNSMNDLNLRYIADVASFVNNRTVRDARFEAVLFKYLSYYLNYFEKNNKGNIKLYFDTNKQALRGHHKNKALLYYIIIMIYCRHYRCPNEQTKGVLKRVIFDEDEDAEDILNYYRPYALEIISKEIL